MGVTAPDQMPSAFLDAFNRRDRVAMLKLYADDAVYLRATGEQVVGSAAIGSVFDALFATQPTMSGAAATVAEARGIALVRMKWAFLVPGQSQRTGVSVEVLQRDADGLWRYILDDPSGGSRS